MTKNPLWKLQEVFALIILQVIIQIHLSKWGPRKGVRKFVSITPEIIRIHWNRENRLGSDSKCRMGTSL